jgi:hypothetical protein
VHNGRIIYCYARVSTDGQSVEAQITVLTAAGAGRVSREVASGTRTNRAQHRRATKQSRALGRGLLRFARNDLAGLSDELRFRDTSRAPPHKRTLLRSRQRIGCMFRESTALYAREIRVFQMGNNQIRGFPRPVMICAQTEALNP